MCFLFPGLLFFTMWAYENLFPDLMVWLLVAACSLWAMVQVYEAFFRLRTRARANRAVVNVFLGRRELCLHMPPNINHAATGRGMRIQLAHLDREFNNLDGATLTEVHPSTVTPAASEEEKNAMPIHKCTVNISASSASSSAPEASSSLASREKWLKKHAVTLFSRL